MTQKINNFEEPVFQLGSKKISFTFKDKCIFWVLLFAIDMGGLFLSWGNFSNLLVFIIFVVVFNGFLILNYFRNCTSLHVFSEFIELVYVTKTKRINYKELRYFKVFPAKIGSFIEIEWETNSGKKGSCAYMLSVKEELEGTRRLANELERVVYKYWRKKDNNEGEKTNTSENGNNHNL